jgi:hypothetical protein
MLGVVQVDTQNGAGYALAGSLAGSLVEAQAGSGRGKVVSDENSR